VKIFIILTFLVLLAIARFFYIMGSIGRKIDKILVDLKRKNFPLKEYRQEWYHLSWTGKNPLRVIALERHINQTSSNYKQAQGLTSAYYSQVKHLIKKGNIPTALVFWLESLHYSKKALGLRAEVPKEERGLLDMEVLGAPYFLVTQIPLIGYFFREKAFEFLESAEHEIKESETDPVNKELPFALIYSKMRELTGDSQYDEKALAFVRRRHDRNQLARVARHLKLSGVDELFNRASV